MNHIPMWNMTHYTFEIVVVSDYHVFAPSQVWDEVVNCHPVIRFFFLEGRTKQATFDEMKAT